MSAVELPNDKAVKVLGVSETVVAQQAECLLLTYEQAANTVRAIMHTGSVTTECNVARQLIDLIAESETNSAPRLQRQAVGASLNRALKDVIGIKECFEDSGASAGIAGVGRGSPL